MTAELVVTGELDNSTFQHAQEQIEESEQDGPELLIIA